MIFQQNGEKKMLLMTTIPRKEPERIIKRLDIRRFAQVESQHKPEPAIIDRTRPDLDQKLSQLSRLLIQKHKIATSDSTEIGTHRDMLVAMLIEDYSAEDILKRLEELVESGVFVKSHMVGYYKLKTDFIGGL